MNHSLFPSGACENGISQRVQGVALASKFPGSQSGHASVGSPDKTTLIHLGTTLLLTGLRAHESVFLGAGEQKAPQSTFMSALSGSRGNPLYVREFLGSGQYTRLIYQFYFTTFARVD